MTIYNHSEKGGNHLMLTIKSLILPFLFFCGVNFALAENGIEQSPFAHITNPTPDNLPTYSGTCEDLYPVTDLNNLITQVYRHLDDDCLYLMKSEELAKKLGIKVVGADIKNGTLFATPPVYIDLLLEKGTDDVKDAFILGRAAGLLFQYKEKKNLNLIEQRKKIGIEHPSMTYASVSFVIYTKKTLNPIVVSGIASALPQLPKPIHHTNLEDYDFNILCFFAHQSNEELYKEQVYYWQGYTNTFIRFTGCKNGDVELAFKKLFYF